MLHIGPDFERPDPALIERFRDLPTATISDVLGPGHALDGRVRALRTGWRVLGCALTLKLPPMDNLGMHVAVSMAAPGDLIVADQDGARAGAPVGEIMVCAARAKGVTGLVLDGVVRDSQALREGDWPVFAIGTHPQQCRKDGPAWIGQPVAVAGVRIRPGDLVIGDDDGVVVVPVARAAAVADAVVAKMAAESRRIAAIASGAVSPLWLEQAIQRVGINND